MIWFLFVWQEGNLFGGVDDLNLISWKSNLKLEFITWNVLEKLIEDLLDKHFSQTLKEALIALWKNCRKGKAYSNEIKL